VTPPPMARQLSPSSQRTVARWTHLYREERAAVEAVCKCTRSVSTGFL
jgi:hypothetical protein